MVTLAGTLKAYSPAPMYVHVVVGPVVEHEPAADATAAVPAMASGSAPPSAKRMLRAVAIVGLFTSLLFIVRL
jgi:hypothetical protein